MNIVYLLPKELRRIYILYMVALLPEMIVCNSSIICTRIMETVEHPRPSALMFVPLRSLQYLLVCKFLEVAQNVACGLYLEYSFLIILSNISRGFFYLTTIII